MAEKSSKKTAVVLNFEVQGAKNFPVTDPEKGRLFIHNVDGEKLEAGTKVLAEVDEGGHGIYIQETVVKATEAVGDFWELAELIGCKPWVPEILYQLGFRIEEGDTYVDNDDGRLFLNNKAKKPLKRGTLVEGKPAGKHGIDIYESNIAICETVRVKNPFDFAEKVGVTVHPKPKPPQLIVILDEKRGRKGDRLAIDYPSKRTKVPMATATLIIDEDTVGNVYIISQEVDEAGKPANIMPNPRQAIEMTYVGNDRIEARFSSKEAEIIVENWDDLIEAFQDMGVVFRGQQPRNVLSQRPRGNVQVTRSHERELEALGV